MLTGRLHLFHRLRLSHVGLHQPGFRTSENCSLTGGTSVAAIAHGRHVGEGRAGGGGPDHRPAPVCRGRGGLWTGQAGRICRTGEGAGKRVFPGSVYFDTAKNSFPVNAGTKREIVEMVLDFAAFSAAS